MSIKKSRRANNYRVVGREYMHLYCELPGGETVQLSIGTGSTDVNGREYVSIGALFNPKAVVEMRQDVPQSANIVIRLPKGKS